MKHESILINHETHLHKSLEKINSSIMVIKLGKMNEIVDNVILDNVTNHTILENYKNNSTISAFS